MVCNPPSAIDAADDPASDLKCSACDGVCLHVVGFAACMKSACVSMPLHDACSTLHGSVKQAEQLSHD